MLSQEVRLLCSSAPTSIHFLSPLVLTRYSLRRYNECFIQPSACWHIQASAFLKPFVVCIVVPEPWKTPQNLMPQLAAQTSFLCSTGLKHSISKRNGPLHEYPTPRCHEQRRTQILKYQCRSLNSSSLSNHWCPSILEDSTVACSFTYRFDTSSVLIALDTLSRPDPPIGGSA